MFGFFKRKKVDPKKVLADTLGDMDLPSFSAGTMEALRLLRDPASNSDTIARSIEGNPGVVVGVIRMVNSAAYGLRQKVDRVSHAINLLGRSRIESVVVALAVKGGLDRAAKGSPKGFWREAAARAAFARSLAELLHPQTQSESFVAGLLQDMAVPLLVRARPEDYAPLLDEWARTKKDELADVEQKEFGWDHSEVGACVAAHWQLPPILTDAIGGHHEGQGLVPPAVHLVSYLQGALGEGDVEPLVDAATAQYNVPADRVIRIIAESQERANDLARLLS
jgi:HD-like signal output (HDOD) protein